MEWYYAENSERRGPYGEAEFNELIRTGRISAETQVWRSGWEDWKPLGEAGLLAAGESAGAARCVECGQTFPTADMIQYQGAWVCPNCKGIFFQKVKEGIEPHAEMEYAGFWIRFVAKFVDGVIVGIPGYGIQFGASALVSQDDPQAFMIVFFITWLISFALQLGYSVWLTGKYGATVGKMACGLRVVTPNGSKISYGVACGRFFAEILSGLILYIGYIMAAFDEEKRALHDRICNTRVIRRRA
jgi:uncharacterized RDD family membrane protein YckC